MLCLLTSCQGTLTILVRRVKANRQPCQKSPFFVHTSLAQSPEAIRNWLVPETNSCTVAMERQPVEPPTGSHGIFRGCRQLQQANHAEARLQEPCSVDKALTLHASFTSDCSHLSSTSKSFIALNFCRHRVLPAAKPDSRCPWVGQRLMQLCVQ